MEDLNGGTKEAIRIVDYKKQLEEQQLCNYDYKLHFKHKLHADALLMCGTTSAILVTVAFMVVFYFYYFYTLVNNDNAFGRYACIINIEVNNISAI